MKQRMTRPRVLAMRWGFALAAWLVAVAPGTARAAAITWSGAISSAWSLGSNWVGGSAPGSADVATFSLSTSPCSITGAVPVGGISISANVPITIASGATVTVSGDFTQSNGTFTANGLLTIGGTFNKTAGTFTNNGGTVMLTSTTSRTFTTAGSTSFNNLVINDGLVGYWKLDDSGALTT